MSRIEMSGQQKLKRELRRMGNKAPKELGNAMYRFAETRIIGPAKDQYVPVRTGVLLSSGFVELPEISGSKVEVAFGFGGAASAYAAIVHETHPTKSKYLQIPLFEALPNAPDVIAADLARRI